MEWEINIFCEMNMHERYSTRKNEISITELWGASSVSF